MNQLKTILLLGALSAMVLGLGALVAPGSMWLFAVLALAMNLGAYFFSDQLVLRLHRAHEVTEAQAPELFTLVKDLSARAGLPMPRVFVMPEAQPNAFATGRNPEHGVVAVTEGLLQRLDRRELRGVLAHELAHIKNRDILLSSIAAAGASLITWVAQALSFGALLGGPRDDEERGGGLLVALVAPVAATLIQLGLSRQREYLADETGAEISGDPEGLARALVRLEEDAAALPADVAPATASLFIVNPFGALETAASWFSTHPATAERIERLLALANRRAAFERNFGRAA